MVIDIYDSNFKQHIKCMKQYVIDCLKQDPKMLSLQIVVEVWNIEFA